MAAAHSPQQLVVTSRRHRLIDSETPGVRIYRTVIDISGTWTTWTPGPVTEIMRPTEAWEGADLPCEPAPRGPALQRQNGLRDPYLFEDTGGRRWLFYAAAGEDSLGVTEITGTAAR